MKSTEMTDLTESSTFPKHPIRPVNGKKVVASHCNLKTFALCLSFPLFEFSLYWKSDSYSTKGDSVFEIQEIAVDPVLPTLRFQCDLKRCKGACCTLPGGQGAPLLDEEIEEIHRAFPVVRKYLSAEHLSVIERDGLFEGSSGDFVTTCVDTRACVFVVVEDGVAKCSFEKAFLNGETDWRKPLSCHLFPIRIDRGMTERIRYEVLPECQPALASGSSNDTLLIDFVAPALKRAFGESWFHQFKEGCSTHQRSDENKGNSLWQP